MECLQLDMQQTKEMFLYLSNKMIESKDRLTQSDKAIGDGDHGIGMAKGFEAVRRKIEDQEFTTLADLFRTVGLALMTSIGGASGAIFGTLYQGAAIKMNDHKKFNAKVLSLFLVAGLAAVQERGKSKPGDKTMVDALEPAATVSQAHTLFSLEAALKAVTEAAWWGKEKTKEMTATVGRAKSLGERALGYEDPGALSTHLMLHFMAEYVTGLNGNIADGLLTEPRCIL